MAQEKREWLKLCEESNGTMFIVPEALKARCEEFKKNRDEFQAVLESMAKQEIEQSVLVNEIVYQFRLWLEKNGHAKNWQKDVGFNTDALEEGVFVLNVSEPSRR